jgi:hypothetical protein
VGCCLAAVVALITPRFVMAILWLFTDYLNRAFGDFIWPFLGFLFLPTTTIGFALAQNEFDGVSGWGLFFVLLGFSLDVGLWGGSGRGWGSRRYRGDLQ